MLHSGYNNPYDLLTDSFWFLIVTWQRFIIGWLTGQAGLMDHFTTTVVSMAVQGFWGRHSRLSINKYAFRNSRIKKTDNILVIRG